MPNMPTVNRATGKNIRRIIAIPSNTPTGPTDVFSGTLSPFGAGFKCHFEANGLMFAALWNRASMPASARSLSEDRWQ